MMDKNPESNPDTSPELYEQPVNRQQNYPNLIRYPKGGAPKQGGRRPSMVKYIRAKTDNCREMIDTMLGIMRGQKTQGVWGSPSYTDVREAVKWLYENVYGKTPIVSVDSDADDSDIHQIMLVYLQKNKNKPGMFDIPPDRVIDLEKDN